MNVAHVSGIVCGLISTRLQGLHSDCAVWKMIGSFCEDPLTGQPIDSTFVGCPRCFAVSQALSYIWTHFQLLPLIPC